MDKIKKCLTYIIMATFPIMSIINIGSTAKFNLALSDIFILMIGFVWIVDIRKFKFKNNYPYFWYFLILIAVFLISNIYNLHSGIVSSGFSGIISEGMKFIISSVYLFIGYNAFEDRNDLVRVLKSWLVGLWIFILYGLYANMSTLNNISFWTFNNNLGEHSRFLGTITDANAAGTYLNFSFFIVLLLINLTDTKRVKIFSYITEFSILICLILTQSRGSWLGFAFGVGCLVLFNLKKIYKLFIFVVPISIILLFGVVILDYETNNAITNNFSSRIEEVIEGDGQFIIRTGLTRIAINMGIDNPIFGVGRGNFVLNSTPYADEIYDIKGDSVYRELTKSIPHNTFIGMFAELGILGFVSFCVIFVILFYKIYNKRNGINTIIIFAVLTFFVQSLTLNLENFRGLWIFLGMALLIQDRDISIFKSEEKFSFKYMDNLFLISLFIAFVVYIFAARRVPAYVNLNSGDMYTYNISVNKTDLPIELTYYIKGSANIKVYEVNDTDTNLITNNGYIDCDGFVKAKLFPNDKTRAYNIVFEGETEKEGVLKNLYYSADDKKYSLIGYKYLPKLFEKVLNGTVLLNYDDYNISNSKEPNYPLDFGNFTLLESRINNMDGYSKISFDIRLNKVIEEDRFLDIVYANDDISNMPNRKNKLIRKYSIKDITKNMAVGDEVTYDIIFKGEDVIYTVNASIGAKSFYIGQINPNSMSLAKYLRELDENKLVIISVMNEGTSGLNYNTINELQKFGLNANLMGKTGFGYIAVGSKNKSIESYEALSDELIQVEYYKGYKLGEYELPFNLRVYSAGYTTGNTANIIIDGVEYSKLRRGMNVVVYDIATNKVVDSTVFDTYLSSYK